MYSINLENKYAFINHKKLCSVFLKENAEEYTFF